MARSKDAPPAKNYDEIAKERQAKKADEYDSKQRERTLGGETVQLKPNVPYGLMLQLADMNNVEPMETFAMAEDIVFSLVDGDEETLARARQFLRDNYTPEDLGQLVDEMVGDVAARPTPAPESSGNGRATTGTSSKEGSSSTPAAPSTP